MDAKAKINNKRLRLLSWAVPIYQIVPYLVRGYINHHFRDEVWSLCICAGMNTAIIIARFGSQYIEERKRIDIKEALVLYGILLLLETPIFLYTGTFTFNHDSDSGYFD
jgi:hypothetical protein